MRIARIDLFHVKPRYLLLRMETDNGLVGWGEPTLEGRTLTVETAVREFARMLIGEDPRRIEHLWQRMYRQTFYRGGPVLCSAISGIEHALWDILGKHLNVPVYQLLGGAVRDRVRVYGRLPDAGGDNYLGRCRERVATNSFTAYKFCPIRASQPIESPAHLDQAERLVAEAREGVGREIDIAIDLHGRASPALARQLLRRFEQYDLMFVEEPVLPGDTDSLVRIAQSTSIPIATGERLFTRWQFQELIERQAVAVLQPDPSHVGGIFETRKIAAAAEARNITMAPHCPLSAVALAVCIQIDACTPNFLCQEQASLGEGLLKQPFKVVDGYIEIPKGPGLGIEIDEEALKENLYDGTWETPTYDLPDGSIAEW